MTRIRNVGAAFFVVLVCSLAAIGLLQVVIPARAQIATPGLPMTQLGYCQLGTLSASIGLASCSGGIPTGANAVIIRIEAQAGRYRTDAVAPTGAVGMPLLVADPPLFFQGPISSLRFIESTSGAKLNVTFFKAPT